MSIFTNILYALIALATFALSIHFLEWILKPRRNTTLVAVHFPDYRLVGLRQRNGLTQREAAKYLGVSYPGYCYYESGKLEPTPEKFYRILEALLIS